MLQVRRVIRFYQNRASPNCVVVLLVARWLRLDIDFVDINLQVSRSLKSDFSSLFYGATWFFTSNSDVSFDASFFESIPKVLVESLRKSENELFVFEKRKKIKFRSAMALGHLCILEFKFEKLKRSVLGFCLGNGNIRSIDFSSPEYPYLRKNIFCVFASPIHSDQHFKRTSLS